MPIKHLPSGSRPEVYRDRLGKETPWKALDKIVHGKSRVLDGVNVIRGKMRTTLGELVQRRERVKKAFEDKRKTLHPTTNEQEEKLRLEGEIQRIDATLRSVVFCIHHVYADVDNLGKKIDKLIIQIGTVLDPNYDDITFCDVKLGEDDNPAEVQFEERPLVGLQSQKPILHKDLEPLSPH